MARAPQMRHRDVQTRTLPTAVGGGGDAERRVGSGLANLSAKLDNVAAKAEAKQTRAGVVQAGRQGSKDGFDPTKTLVLREGTEAADVAYNAAARRTYLKRSELDARDTMDALETQYSNDPVAMADAMAKSKAGILSGVPDQIKPDMSLLLDQLERPYALAALRRNQAAVLETDKGDLVEQLTVRGRDLGRLAFHNNLDEAGDLAVAGHLDGIRNLLITHGPKAGFEFDGEKFDADITRSDALAPANMAKYLDDAKSDARVARIDGAFSRLGGERSQKEFIKSLGADFKTGKGLAGDLSVDEFEKLTAGFNTVLTKQNARKKQVANDAKRQITDINSVIANGFTPTASALSNARVLALGSGDPEVQKKYNDMLVTQNVVSQARLGKPVDLENWIVRQRAKPGGADRATSDRVKAMESLLGKMQSEIKKDPVAWAARVGLVDVVPLDFNSDDMPAQLANRRNQGNVIADYYNTKPRYFTESEIQELRVRSDGGGASMLAAANTIAGAFGEDSISALAEISETAPQLAHIGGMLNSGGSPAFIQDATDGIELGGIDGFESRLPKPTLRKEIQADVFGTAFVALPSTGAAAIQASQSVYESRALRSGVFGGDIPGQDDEKLYERALQESIGATFVGKTRFGGIADVQDRQVIAPSWLRADKFDDVVAKLADTDWVAGSAFGAPLDADGAVVPAKVLKNAFLVSVGKDRYRVSLTDPAEGAQYVGAQGAPDGLFILDMDKLHTRMRFDGRFKNWVFDAIEETAPKSSKKITSGEAVQIAFARANGLDVSGDK